MKKYCGDFLLIQNIILVILGFSLFQGTNYVQALNYNTLQQSQSDYENEIQLEYGVPMLLSEVSVPSNTIFSGSIINGFYIVANFSNNNGSIWINNFNEEIVWLNFLYENIETFINLNGSSSNKYSLWGNSTTLGDNTLYYTFRPEIIYFDNIGLAVLIILLPIIIIIIFIVEKRRKGDSRSVSFAKKVGERLALKLENKNQGKLTRILRYKSRIEKKAVCPKCSVKITNLANKFCKDCGYKLRD